MKTPNLHLVDDNGDELSGSIIDAVNNAAKALFGRYRSHDPAEVCDVLELSGKIAARAVREGKTLSSINGFVWRTAFQRMMHRIDSKKRERAVAPESLASRQDLRISKERIEGAIAVRQALAQLSPRERAILWMKSDRFSANEIGRRLNMSPASVNTTASRARDKVLKLLGGDDPTRERVLRHLAGIPDCSPELP
jgi:RNA polymerase sigma factor (sigma-70 family)